MHTRVSPATFLAVRHPAFIPPDQRRRHTEARLARNVAVLFGVPVDRAPAGRTWVCDYNELTIKEIGRGAPKEVEHRELDVIPTATLHRYGPETKAALVLAAADRLFATVEPTMRDVLSVLGTCDDGRPYADAMRATTWASLVAYAFQAQPALFVAAVRARTVQRAATARWSPLVRPGYDAFAGEYGVPGPEPTTPRPQTLGILDTLMHEVVAPRSPVTMAAVDGEGGGPSDHFLVDNLIDRWIRHLVYSADSGVALARQDDQGHWLDAYVPHLSALSSFAADMIGHYHQIEPFGGSGPGGDTPLEQFRQERPEHVRRLVPRVPSLPEFIKLPRPSQEALIEVTLQLTRTLHAGVSFNGQLMHAACRDALERVVELARSVLGADAVVTRNAELGLARYRHMDLRDQDSSEVGEAVTVIRDRYQDLRSSFRDGSLSAGDWVECVNTNSARLNTIAQDLLQRGKEEEAAEVRASLSDDWAEVLGVIGLVATGDAEPDFTQQPIAISSLAHNYVGFELRGADKERRLRALEIARTVVIPQRRLVAAQRGNDNAIRLSLQVTLRGACLLLPELEGRTRDALLEDIGEWVGQLRETAMARLLLEGGAVERHVAAHVNVLTALLLGEITLAEHHRAAAPGGEAVTLLLQAERDVSGVRRFVDLERTSANVALVLEILDRYETLTGDEVSR